MAIGAHEKPLLTGAAGGSGVALRDRLKANCDLLRLSDRLDFGPARVGEEIVLGDLADADAVNAIVASVQAIVKLGCGFRSNLPLARSCRPTSWAPSLRARPVHGLYRNRKHLGSH